MYVDEQAERARVATLMEQDPNAIFVFGSNEAGRHGGGAAYDALRCHRALMGKGFGPNGRSFALPTKDWHINTLPLALVKFYVTRFLAYARSQPKEIFVVTRIGCGLAGFTDEQIAPLFGDAPENCKLPLGWREFVQPALATV